MNEKIVNLLRVVEAEGASAALSLLFYDGNWHTIYKSKLYKITQIISRIAASKNIPEKFQNCAGNFNPDGSIIAIIGERPAAESELRRSYPFADVDGCSGWLNELLFVNKISESKIFWVNAVNLDGSFNDPDIINRLQPKEIICLGKIASGWANKNGWEHKMFYHPQYWKRFKASEDYPLVTYLRNACSAKL